MRLTDGAGTSCYIIAQVLGIVKGCGQSEWFGARAASIRYLAFESRVASNFRGV